MQTIPVIRIVNEGSNIGSISYMNIIKYKLMSENIFIELPEDKVELIDENVDDEVLIQEDEIEKNEENNVKSVTLDWKNELRNETKYKIDVEKLKNEKLKFNLKNKDTEVIIYHTHTTETYSKSSDFNYDEIYLPYEEETIYLDRHSNALHLIQRLRDEAHRFAITHHRKLRANASVSSRLDGIPGVGAVRKKAILKHFRTVENLKNATEEDIGKVPGLPANVARDVYKYLHEEAVTTSEAADENA